MSAAQIVRALGGRWNGHHGSARCPAHEDRDPSLSIDERDGKILLKCFAGCDNRDVIAALRARHLWPESSADRQAPNAQRRRRQTARHCGPTPQQLERSDLARERWRNSGAIEGTIAEQYLRSRGITLPLPPTLRFLASSTYRTRQSFPALIAAVQHADGKVRAAQVTLLSLDGVGKAGVSDPRELIGPLGDGAIRLGPVETVMGVAEGTESALSAMQLFNVSCWVTLGAARMDRVAIPERVRRVIIFADADDTGREAANRAVLRYRTADREVLIRSAPQGDWNDVLRARRGIA